MRKKIKKEEDSSLEDEIFPLPIYKAEDDIYSREMKESLEDEDNFVKKDTGDFDNSEEYLKIAKALTAIQKINMD